MIDGSVMPANSRSSNTSGRCSSSVNARTSARRPAPFIDTSVPSMSNSRTVGRTELQSQLAGDQDQLDLGGSLGDGHEPRIAPVALDRKLRDVAVAAVDL